MPGVDQPGFGAATATLIKPLAAGKERLRHAHRELVGHP